MAYEPLESILVVFQNHIEGRQASYDDWYTNIHIRDAMRLDGAIATQRFIANDHQPILDGKRVTPGHWAHTVYEWESAKKSVDGHRDRAGTPLMEISSDGAFKNLRDYFFHPVFLSHGWTREAGFRRGDQMLTAMIVPPPGEEAAFTAWFRDKHVPATLALPGFGSVGLFTYHEEQSLPDTMPFRMVALYAMTDRAAALEAWAARHDSKSDLDLSARVKQAEVTCWQPRIARLLASDVLNPPPPAAAEERRARALYKDRFLPQEKLFEALSSI